MAQEPVAQKDWSQNDELFLKELEEGHAWQSYPALFFKLHGLKVEVPRLTIRENIEEADKWKNSIDLFVEDVPFENKSRNEEFTYSGDFPYETIFVDTVEGYDAKEVKPYGYIMVSKPTGCLLWLPSSTPGKWTKEKKFDNTRQITCEFYMSDVKHLRPISTLVKYLRSVRNMNSK